MSFSYIDLNNITEEQFIYLKSINRWIDKETTEEVYVVIDNDDIKSVIALKKYKSFVDKELFVATKEKARNNGYASFGIYMVLQVVYNNPSIRLVQVNSITNKFNIDKCICNPNFDNKYLELDRKLRFGGQIDELMALCDDEVMVHTLNIWIKSHREYLERLKEEKKSRLLKYKKCR